MEWIPALSPTSCVSRGASPEVRWSPPLLWKQHIQSLPDFPQEFCSTASSTTLWTGWIPALSPTRWNIQTMTKSFVDKRMPWQNGVPDWHVGNKLSFQVNWTLWIDSIALSSSDHPSSIQNHWSIQSGFTAFSPTRRNVQTTTKSFVDKRRPRQNRVPDQHVGNKLSFQVNWTLWIDSIALSSSDHPSSI